MTTETLTLNGYDQTDGARWLCSDIGADAKERYDCIYEHLNNDNTRYIYYQFDSQGDTVSDRLDLTDNNLQAGDYKAMLSIEGYVNSGAQTDAERCPPNLTLEIESMGQTLYSYSWHVKSNNGFETYETPNPLGPMTLTREQIVGLHLIVTGKGKGHANGNEMRLSTAVVQLTRV